MTETLSLAVCLFDNVNTMDYSGPVELLSYLLPEPNRMPLPISRHLLITHLAPTLDPVKQRSGPAVIPEKTYKDAIDSNIQYDILLVPGGPFVAPGEVPDDLERFLKHQIPGARYVLGVCTGNWILARTGVLDGKRATTNKSMFKMIKEATSDKIQWVPKARWVIDGKVWTSSGVTAGMDMTIAFLKHIAGEEAAKIVQDSVELSAKDADDDEFAAVHHLLDEA